MSRALSLNQLMAAALVAMACSACSDRANVGVRAFFQPGIPLADVELTAIPFDADRLLDSLAAAAPTPRPAFSSLEERVRGYHRSDTTATSEDPSSTAAWLAIKDSVSRLARELARGDRKAPAYRERYAFFRQLYARYGAKQAERESRLRGALSSDRELATEATRASDSLRAWEAQAYARFPQLADARVAASGRAVQRVRTDSAGNAGMTLANGTWWIMARVPDPDNPFEEISWSVPVRVQAGLPFSVPLMQANASSRWRH